MSVDELTAFDSGVRLRPERQQRGERDPSSGDRVQQRGGLSAAGGEEEVAVGGEDVAPASFAEGESVGFGLRQAEDTEDVGIGEACSVGGKEPREAESREVGR